jgi:hypothetical protein
MALAKNGERNAMSRISQYKLECDKAIEDLTFLIDIRE